MADANVYQLLKQAANAYRGAEYVVVGGRDQVATYASMLREADLWARYLYDLGLGPGSRLAIALPNCTEWLAAAFGAARIGAVTVGVSTRLMSRELAHVLEATQPSVLLTDPVVRGRELLGGWSDALRQYGLARSLRVVSLAQVEDATQDNVPGVVFSRWPSLQAGKEVPEPPITLAEAVARMKDCEFPELAGTAVIMFTSGSSAFPKGVMLGHRQLTDLANAVAKRQGLGRYDGLYSVAPFFHCSGFMHGALVCLASGATLFTTGRYNFNETWQVLADEDVTASHGAQAPLLELTRDPRVQPETFGSLDRIWCGVGARRMGELEVRLGVTACELYGLTETGGNSSICTTADPRGMRFYSDGKPLDGIEIDVVDADGSRQPNETPGEIVIRGWNLMNGYFRDKEATACAMDREGWFHTRDLGTKLGDGAVRWLSRLSDVIRVGGENLAPAEVENVIQGHGSVDQVAVVAMPDARLGEVPVAFVVPTVASMDLRVELDDYCKQELAQFKRPRKWLFMDALPRTDATHRIKKAELRSLLGVAPEDK